MTTTITGATGIDNIKAATGAVLQVVSAEVGGLTTTSNSYVDTPVTLAITPTSSSSKILVQVNINGFFKNAVQNAYISMRLLRGSSVISHLDNQGGYTASALAQSWSGPSSSYLDSPSTTSSITYKVQMKTNEGSVSMGYGSTKSFITLMEIAG